MGTREGVYTLIAELEGDVGELDRAGQLNERAWHKTLVERMSLDIPNVRPALFTARQDQEDVYALLKFRHRFGNLYGEDLNPELVSRLQTRIQGLLQRFPEIHARFRSNLTAVAEEL